MPSYLPEHMQPQSNDPLIVNIDLDEDPPHNPVGNTQIDDKKIDCNKILMTGSYSWNLGQLSGKLEPNSKNLRTQS